MYKRLLKKSTAIILASALVFSSSTVYAQENEKGKGAELVKSGQSLEDSTYKTDSEVSKDEKEDVQEKNGNEIKEEEPEQKEDCEPEEERQKEETENFGDKKDTDNPGDSQAEDKAGNKQENSETKTLLREEVQKKAVEEEGTNKKANLSVSITGPSYIGEAGTGIENIMSFQICNEGENSISITSADYELKIVPEGETVNADIRLENIQEELDSKGQNIQPGGIISFHPVYTISQVYTGKTIDYTVQLMEKESGEVVAKSSVISADVFTVADGVLRYHDTSKGEKYLITFDMGDGVTFDGNIGGGEGNSTVVGSGPDIASYQYYLDTGHKSSFMFGSPEGTSISAELVPTDAGTAEAVWTSSPNIISIDLHAPATLKVRVTDKFTLYGENGFSVSCPTTDPNAQILLGSELQCESYTDQTVMDQLKNIEDSYARMQGYTLEIMLPQNWDYTKFIPKGGMTVTMPLPDGWDSSRTEVYVTDAYSFSKVAGSVSEDGKRISFTTTGFAQASTLNCILMERSIPTEVKDWERVISKYYETVRAVNWFREPLENHYFESVPPANDAAYLAYHFSGKFYMDSSYYDPESNEIKIPYDEFAREVEKYFKNVPDLTAVDIPDYMYYEKEGDQFILPVGGGAGDPSYTYALADVKEAGGVYALWFEIAEENAQCTLMVEDNGDGDWRYIAFLEGFQWPEGNSTEDPEDTEQPEDPGTTERPENTVPGELSPQQIQSVIQKLRDTEPGGNVTIAMGSATIVPEEILENAKGKNLTLVLEMDGYTWTIYGKDITASDLKDIDLEVRIDVNAVSEESVKKLAGENPVKQISLTYSGDFGFKANLKIYMGTEYTGKYGNLFWFKNGTTSELTDTDEIDQQGYAEFAFTHASDYVIVISDKEKSDTGLKGQKISNNPTSDKNGSKISGKEVKAVKTGDSSNTTVYLAILVLAGSALILLSRRKKTER